jgi:hypothetical protein
VFRRDPLRGDAASGEASRRHDAREPGRIAVSGSFQHFEEAIAELPSTPRGALRAPQGDLKYREGAAEAGVSRRDG